MNSPPYYLTGGAPLAPADAPELPAEINGQPVGYFWADGIRAGRYVHPAGRFELRVDGARLDAWAANFRRMRAAGIDVPVPVDHSSAARDNLGYVVDVRREGDTLRLLHQLIGDDAIKLAARNKVSLGIDPEFADGTGQAFGDCVVHSSLTPVPLVPGQAGFMPLSAGEAGGGAAGPMVFHLSDGDAGDDVSVRDAVREVTGDASVTTGGAVPALLGWARQARGRLVEMSRDAPAPGRAMPAAVAVEYAELYGRQTDELAAAGHISPACRDQLRAMLRPAGQPSRLLLSRDVSSGSGERLIDGLLAALRQNVCLSYGPATGVQTLARLTPGGDGDDAQAAVRPDLQQRMVRMANGRA